MGRQARLRSYETNIKVLQIRNSSDYDATWPGWQQVALRAPPFAPGGQDLMTLIARRSRPDGGTTGDRAWLFRRTDREIAGERLYRGEAAVTVPAGSRQSGEGTVRKLAVQDALTDEAGPGADR